MAEGIYFSYKLNIIIRNSEFSILFLYLNKSVLINQELHFEHERGPRQRHTNLKSHWIISGQLRTKEVVEMYLLRTNIR